MDSARSVAHPFVLNPRGMLYRSGKEVCPLCAFNETNGQITVKSIQPHFSYNRYTNDNKIKKK